MFSAKILTSLSKVKVILARTLGTIKKKSMVGLNLILQFEMNFRLLVENFKSVGMHNVVCFLAKDFLIAFSNPSAHSIRT